VDVKNQRACLVDSSPVVVGVRVFIGTIARQCPTIGPVEIWYNRQFRQSLSYNYPTFRSSRGFANNLSQHKRHTIQYFDGGRPSIKVSFAFYVLCSVKTQTKALTTVTCCSPELQDSETRPSISSAAYVMSCLNSISLC
jgi:hypothetical protein